MREIEWRPDDPDDQLNALVPARTLADTAKTLGPLGGEVTVALSQGGAGEGMIGFAGGTRRTTSRLLDGANYPPGPLAASRPATTPRPGSPVAALTEVVKRVALVAERTTPVRLQLQRGRARRRGRRHRGRPGQRGDGVPPSPASR